MDDGLQHDLQPRYHQDKGLEDAKSGPELQSLANRRRFLVNSGMGLGTSALASLLIGSQSANASPTHGENADGLPKGCHHAPRAKRVIFLFMAGAPSQVDLFDYKPDLGKQFKKPLPPSVSMGQRVTAMTKGKAAAGRSERSTSSSGTARVKTDLWMCELLPHSGDSGGRRSVHR